MLATLPWSELGVLAAAGALSGLLMGLFGIAGGTVLVPVQCALLTTVYGASADQAIKIAVASSLGCIVVSTLAKLLAQSRLGTLRAGTVAPMLLPIAAGAAVAALLSPRIPALFLQRIFAGYLVAYLLYSVLKRHDGPADASLRLPALEARVVGLGIGFAAALLGIGGAFLSTPYLVLRGMSVKGANAASPAIVLAVSIVGTAAYLCVPSASPAPGTVGSVALPLVLALGLPAAAASLLAERWSALLSGAVHRRAFECFLLVVALKIFAGA